MPLKSSAALLSAGQGWQEPILRCYRCLYPQIMLLSEVNFGVKDNKTAYSVDEPVIFRLKY